MAKRIEADYIKSAKFGDLLEVKTSLIEIKNVSFRLLQEIFRENEKVFEMHIDLVYIDFAGKMAKIPQEEKEFLSQYSIS